MRQRHFIDLHKGVTGLAVLGLIAWFDRWESTTAWLYLALHGTYGLLWVLKSRIFPDKQWERPATIWWGLYAWTGLTLYWVSPWLITSRGLEAPPWYLALCTAIWGVGLFLHFAADMQKHTSLALRPGLITTGLWARTRNPNYLGELLIYLGFGLLPMHWAPLLVLLLFVAIVWVPNMRRKESSLARYPEFAQYRRHSGLFLPF